MADQVERLSLRQAEHLLEGVKYFRLHPEEKEWQGLDRKLFLFTLQNLTQLQPIEEESVFDYLLRNQSLLESIIFGEESAPSIPQNLDELVAAWEEFQAEQNAESKPTQMEYPTIEDWLENLQEKFIQQEAQKAVEKTPASASAQQEAVKTITQHLTQKELITLEVVATAVEKTDLPAPQQQTAVQQLQSLAVTDYTPPIEAQPASVQLHHQTQKALSPHLPAEEPIQEISRHITVSLINNAPRLSPEEAQQLSPEDVNQNTTDTVNASLGEITDAISQQTELSPGDTHRFLRQLQLEIAQSLLGISQTKANIHPARVEQTAALPETATQGRDEVSQSTALVEKNPGILYQLRPTGQDTSVGEAVRHLVEHRGINEQSTDLVRTITQPVQSLTRIIQGKAVNFQQHVQTARQQLRSPQLLGILENRLVQIETFRRRQTQLLSTFNHYHQEIRRRLTRRASLGQQLRRVPLVQRLPLAWQKAKQSLGQVPLFKNLFSLGKRKGLNFLKDQLGSLKIFAGKGVKKLFAGGAGKGLKKLGGSLLKKFGATKLGAVLGSAPGAAIGFAIDLGKKALSSFGSLMQKITGGQTQAEQQIQKAFGPFGKVITSPVGLLTIIAVVGPILVVFLFVLNLFQIEGTALVKEMGGGTSNEISQMSSLTPNPEYEVEQLVAAIQQCQAIKDNNGFINEDNLTAVKSCLQDGGFTNGAINQIAYSVNQHKSLQCVGFVKALEAQNGRSLPTCGHAKDYIGCGAVSNNTYQYIDCDDAQPGTIAVFNSGQYGHIGVVSHAQKQGNITRLRIASAWGTKTKNGGRVTIAPFSCAEVDAFIQP